MSMLKSHLPSKLDWYNYITKYSKLLSIVKNYDHYSFRTTLPSALQLVTMAFIDKLIAGKKKLLPLKDMVPALVPRYLEFTVTDAFKMFEKDKTVMSFFQIRICRSVLLTGLMCIISVGLFEQSKCRRLYQTHKTNGNSHITFRWKTQR